MKNYFIFLFLMVALTVLACNNKGAVFNADEYDSFGEAFKVENVKTNGEAAQEFAKLNVGDSIKIQFKASIQEVCSSKGCWMNLDLGNEETSFVKFKDYGFFVPKDAAGREVIVKGWAQKKETSVESLRHYAEDAGKSPEEIAAITEPELEYFFMADGVWMKK